MKKRMIALFLTFAMLVPLTPAVAADDNVPRPTVEEILSEYHQKAFEAEAVGETATASTYSRTGSSGKTLEQETVDTLNAAGYEAYNVTAENYEALEAQLQTDFADMGLDPDGSYIITISGEDSENSHASGINPRVMVPYPIEGGGGFHYTYNGTTYTMRYLTVTATEFSGFFKHDSIKISEITDYSNFDSFLNMTCSLIADYVEIPGLGTVLSILGLAADVLYTADGDSFTLQCATNWTRKYVQVYNSNYSEWKNASCSEYAETASTYSGYIYNTSSRSTEYIQKVANKTVYSSKYYNTTQQKIDAVIGYLENRIIYDLTGDLDFCYDGKVAITLKEEIVYITSD